MMGSVQCGWMVLVLCALLALITCTAVAAAAPDHSLRFIYSKKKTGDSAGPVKKLCPDHKVTCPALWSCCPVVAGVMKKKTKYGCCPYLQAVCCPDELTCCPRGYQCTGSTCQPDYRHVPALPKLPATVRVPPEEDVVCPDGGHCDSGQTCCLVTTGQYGCCLYPQASCCADKQTCCPHDYQCNGHSCQAGHHTLPALPKVPAKPRVREEDLVCPDGGHCDSGQTCCLLTTGQYGCCLYPQASCCADKQTCCPHDYQCNGHSCQAGHHTLPALPKVPAKHRVPPEEDVVCPDGGHCDSGQTCCLMATGQYGCCLYPQASCCADKQTCCPHDYQCTGHSCQAGHHTLPALPKVPAKPRRGAP